MLIKSIVAEPNINEYGDSVGCNKYCESVTFWYGSGSGDPCLCPMDPDPAIIVLDLQDTTKNYFFA